MHKAIAGLLCGLLFSWSAWAALDLNKATRSELESVKGIGPAKAKIILEHRDKNGPFKSLDDLMQVKGFGKASVEKLKGQVTVGEVAAASRK
ncbi:MAG TPA: helix-hairpin-helix domain-containing protein [Thiobacillaceae bacterium]|nr:helix-hairpin-helix domain-containing protein [Thiobacillaceae bacterium]HNU64032.1 helix-hairpin-helix domain-containing protein [Thiobacillaceae bacterium]